MRNPIYAAPVVLVLLGFGSNAMAAPKASGLPGCAASSSTSSVVDHINTMIMINPALKMMAGGIRASSLSKVKELYADEGVRACEATIRRSNGTDGEVGYTITWLRRDARVATVQIENLGQLRETYARTVAPAAPESPPLVPASD